MRHGAGPGDPGGASEVKAHTAQETPPAQPLAERTLRKKARKSATTWATATPYRLPLAVAAVALVVSAPFGGWRTAESEGVPVAAVNETVQAAPFEITLERAYHSPRPSESFSELDPGQQYVVVLGTLTSHHDATVDSVLLTEAVTIQGLPMPLNPLGIELADGTQVEPLLYSAADSTPLRRIGPDLTYDIGLVYTTGSSELPQELTLRIDGHTWRASFFDQQMGWRDPAVVAQVVVPLAEQESPTDSPGESGDESPEESGAGLRPEEDDA